MNCPFYLLTDSLRQVKETLEQFMTGLSRFLLKWRFIQRITSENNQNVINSQSFIKYKSSKHQFVYYSIINMLTKLLDGPQNQNSTFLYLTDLSDLSKLSETKADSL